MLRKLILPLVVFALAAPGVRAAPLFDIMVLFDGSGSISNSDYEDQRSLGQYLFNSLTVSPTDNQFGIVQFSTGVTLESGLNGNAASLTNALNNMNQSFGQTNHADAFTTAHNELTVNGRAGAQQVVILLTDGNANEPGGNPLLDAFNAAEALKNDGALVFGMGFGNNVDIANIEFYTSAPSDDHAFHVQDFSDGVGAIDSIVAELNSLPSPPEIPAPGAVIIFGIAALSLMRQRAVNALPV
jgi:hypothetical protein